MSTPLPIPPALRRPGRRAGRLLACLVVGSVLAAGCVDDDQDARPPGTTLGPGISEADAGRLGTGGPGQLVLAATLRTTTSCDALLSELKAEALEHVGPYGLDGSAPIFSAEGDARTMSGTAESSAGGGAAGAPVAGSAGADAPATNPASAASDSGTTGGPTDHSSTTTQEEGVDEPDLVKTDGRRMVVVSGQTVRVLDVSGRSPVLTGTIQLPAEVYGGELFLDGDRALLMTTGWSERPLRETASMTVPAGVGLSRLVELDLAGGRIVRTLQVEGSYLSARDVEGVVRVVVTSPVLDLPFVYPSNPSAEASAEAANRAVIEQSTIEQWLPAYRTLDATGNVTGEGQLVPCEKVHLPDQFAGFGSLSVLTVDLDAGLALGDAVSVLSDGQTVYASTDRLVVATARWVDPRVLQSGDESALRRASEEFSTALHTFDISDPVRTTYVASGALAGALVNQFALDEHDGMIRVATTEGELWGEQPSSESFVTVLREVDGGLALVGRVGGLGKGEAIQSVRFLDDVAYVVTFRQVDPLYVVDLADPSAPRVTGELKIPGFSSYLHPLGPDAVLGIGQDATEEGRVTGGQLSLFDVSNPADPRRVGQLALGPDTWSLAGQDHRALLWWEPQRLAILPVSQSAWASEGEAERQPFEGVAVIRIGEDGEMTELGRFGHPAAEQCPSPIGPEPRPVEPGPAATDAAGALEDGGSVGATATAAGAATSTAAPVGEECFQWQPSISRAIVVGDALYTVSEQGVQANALADLSVRGFVAFPA